MAIHLARRERAGGFQRPGMTLWPLWLELHRAGTEARTRSLSLNRSARVLAAGGGAAAGAAAGAGGAAAADASTRQP